MKKTFKIIAMTLFVLLAHSTAHTTAPALAKVPAWCVTPKALQPDVQFWLNVYTQYDNDTAVLHDTEFLGVIYGTVDLHDLHCIDDCLESVKKARIDRVKEAKDKVRDILLTLANTPPDAALSPEAKTIKAAWRKWTSANIFQEAAGDKRLRSQTGQKTRFGMGLPAAEQYMPKFEAIFKNEGLPIELTRLVMVESMFNMNALSHAGASGVWQFMPATARKFGLRVSKSADDRSDPIQSTYAAARMLKYDYDRVGTWPLAINSYNAGRGHLERAIAALGTHDIVKIIRNYRVGSYGFASRNYYPEFLAACQAYDNRATYFPNMKHLPPLK
jgi:membrane-bound lytic murein transglycosylase D